MIFAKLYLKIGIFILLIIMFPVVNSFTRCKVVRHIHFSSSANEIFTISSSQNSQVKLFRSLKVKKKRDEHGLVLLEGFRPIVDAINIGLKPHRILVSDSLSSSSSMQYQRLQESMKEYLLPFDICLQVTENILSSVSDTEHSQGIIAAFKRPQSWQMDSSANALPLIVLLDGIADPGNAGTIIRSAYGLGATAVVGVQTCDLWSPKVLRASMGCSLRFPVIECNWKNVKDILHKILTVQSTTSSSQIFVADGSDVENLHYNKVDFKSQSTILVIGSEATGPSEEIDKLGIPVTRIQIPMIRAVESFNAGVAASIILAEAARQRSL